MLYMLRVATFIVWVSTHDRVLAVTTATTVDICIVVSQCFNTSKTYTLG
jgi:hypothetical protein